MATLNQIEQKRPANVDNMNNIFDTMADLKKKIIELEKTDKENMEKIREMASERAKEMEECKAEMERIDNELKKYKCNKCDNLVMKLATCRNC